MYIYLNEAGFIWFVVYYSFNMLPCILAFLRLLISSIVNLFISIFSYATVLLWGIWKKF